MFTDLATVKAWASVTVATDDALLTDLIASVTKSMQQYMSQNILAAAYTETYNGSGTTRQALRQNPVTAVTALTILGQTIAPATSPLGAGFLFDDLGVYLTPGTLVPVPAYAAPALSVFPRMPLSVQVTYNAGFATVPADLKGAATRQVVYEYRGRQREGEASKTLGPSMTTAFLTDSWNPRTLQVMDTYRRRAPV